MKKSSYVKFLHIKTVFNFHLFTVANLIIDS